MGNNCFSCTEWVRLVGEEDFLYFSVLKLNSTRFVCSCHFVDANYLSSKVRMFLKPSAIPSIFDKKTVPISETDMKKFLSPQIIFTTRRKCINIWKKCYLIIFH